MPLNMRSGQAFYTLIENYDFKTVLDIGGAKGTEGTTFASLFEKHGKRVYISDLFKGTFVGDFNSYDFGEYKFDCVWCSHTLEHQLNVNSFLKKINSLLKEGGVLAISVPPLKHQIVGGHVSLWNAGLLLYNLILAGFDCSNAQVKSYGYDISVIVKKQSFRLPRPLVYDQGDIETLARYFPKDLNVYQSFDGNIREINWSSSKNSS